MAEWESLHLLDQRRILFSQFMGLDFVTFLFPPAAPAVFLLVLAFCGNKYGLAFLGWRLLLASPQLYSVLSLEFNAIPRIIQIAASHATRAQGSSLVQAVFSLPFWEQRTIFILINLVPFIALGFFLGGTYLIMKWARNKLVNKLQPYLRFRIEDLTSA